jgi:hypothetical protein
VFFYNVLIIKYDFLHSDFWARLKKRLLELNSDQQGIPSPAKSD